MPSHFPAGTIAEVAELADALASGASGGNPVQVQVLSSALQVPGGHLTLKPAIWIPTGVLLTRFA